MSHNSTVSSRLKTGGLYSFEASFVNPEERKNLYPEYVGSVFPREVVNHRLVYTVSDKEDLNLKAPRFLYIGQALRYSPENAFYIFNQQIYFII